MATVVVNGHGDTSLNTKKVSWRYCTRIWRKVRLPQLAFQLQVKYSGTLIMEKENDLNSSLLNPAWKKALESH